MTNMEEKLAAKAQVAETLSGLFFTEDLFLVQGALAQLKETDHFLHMAIELSHSQTGEESASSVAYFICHTAVADLMLRVDDWRESLEHPDPTADIETSPMNDAVSRKKVMAARSREDELMQDPAFVARWHAERRRWLDDDATQEQVDMAFSWFVAGWKARS